MLEKLKNLLGFSETQSAPDAAALAAFEAQLAAAQSSGGGTQNAANDEAYSLTGDVNAVLEAQLRKHKVTQYGPNGSTRPAGFPLSKISLTSLDGYSNHSNSHAIRLDGDDENDKRAHGERVTLEATLSRPIEDYDVNQLKVALTNVVSAIPAFKGKVIAKPIEPKHATYKEVEAELLAVLPAGAFKPEEMATLKKFFEATPNKQDAAPQNRWDSNVDVTHREGKLHVRLGSGIMEPIALGGEKKEAPAESSDQVVVDYFKAHRKPLLEKMKSKVAALRKADGTPVVTEAELANLDLHATANYGIELLLGTKPAIAIDPATNQKLVGEVRAKKFTETPLVKVDTDKLAEIFNESLIEVSNPLPPMLDKFASGHMIAQILRQRLPNNPELEAFIAKHDMFLTLAEKKAKEPTAKSPDQVVLDEPCVNTGSYRHGEESKHARISVSFDLPEGMTLHPLYEHIAASRNQLGLGVQQQAENELGGRAA